MPKFNGQNKKRIDPRYFLEETVERTEDLEILKENEHSSLTNEYGGMSRAEDADLDYQYRKPKYRRAMRKTYFDKAKADLVKQLEDMSRNKLTQPNGWERTLKATLGPMAKSAGVVGLAIGIPELVKLAMKKDWSSLAEKILDATPIGTAAAAGKLIKRLVTNAEKFKDYQKGIERTLKPDSPSGLDPDRIPLDPKSDYMKRLTTTLNEKPFPDLTGDGEVTYADILKGRGVFDEEGEIEETFSGNGPLSEPIDEKKKKRKRKKSKSSRCTKVTKKTSSTRKGKKWMKCVKSDSGGYKRIHWGQAGVRVTGKSGNTKRKKSFKARHGCSSAKSNTPKGQACKDWAEE